MRFLLQNPSRSRRGLSSSRQPKIKSHSRKASRPVSHLAARFSTVASGCNDRISRSAMSILSALFRTSATVAPTSLLRFVSEILSSSKRTKFRIPLVDIDAPPGEAEGFDPTLLIGDVDMLPPNELLDGKERHTAAKSWRAELSSSLQNKPELLAVADAIFEEITDCSEIAVLCDCSVERVYELKRALKKHTIQLFGVRTTAELERKTMGT